MMLLESLEDVRLLSVVEMAVKPENPRMKPSENTRVGVGEKLALTHHS